MALFRHFSRHLCKTYEQTNTDLLNVYNRSSVCSRKLSYRPMEYEYNKADPAPFFFRKDIQNLLRSLTRVDVNKVFRIRKSGDSRLEDPVYKFLTEEELQEAMEQSNQKTDELLQIPPVLKVRRDSDKVLSRDPALKGLETSRFVFTDISFGIKDSERIIVVRDQDGTLKEAEWTVKDRMNQIYFPKQHRHLKTPKLFIQDEYLENLLNRKEYEYLLDRACLQFEPNDPLYQRTVSVTYQHLNDNNDFDSIRSTRHFGGLVFFLVWNKNIDNLLLNVIETGHVNEAQDLLNLYATINNIKFENTECLEVIKEYIKKYGSKKGALELALQAYSELLKQKRELDKGIKAAHGIS